MAAKTPSTVLIENFGQNTLYIATFSDIDTGDTWASKITSAVAYWGNLTDDGTQTKEAIDITYTQSSGSFTFHVGEADRTAVIYVLAKS